MAKLRGIDETTTTLTPGPLTNFGLQTELGIADGIIERAHDDIDMQLQSSERMKSSDAVTEAQFAALAPIVENLERAVKDLRKLLSFRYHQKHLVAERNEGNDTE